MYDKSGEYYKCLHCGQVVQGFIASQQIECCEAPDYVPLEEKQEEGEDEKN